ncbi:hypothetical protein M5689_020425 [Euphorbia peplus]|nr:hypothetical protein M5689_020425 [Euphorbia peplus]
MPSLPEQPSTYRGQNWNCGDRQGGRRGRGQFQRGGGRWNRRNNYGARYSNFNPAPQQSWAGPPCPYPSWGVVGQQWSAATPNAGRFQQHRAPFGQPGILGSRPNHHAYITQDAPTDINQAMHTMTLEAPSVNWHMDTGATSHMTGDLGMLTSYLNKSTNQSIIVENNTRVPIVCLGSTILHNNHKPLALNNVLHAPKLIKNLIYVRKFNIDNHVSVEFDPFGFSVKDLHTGIPIMRCDSTSDLYPIAS